MKSKKNIWLGIGVVFLIGLFFILPAVQVEAANPPYIPTTNETGLSSKPIKDILENFLNWILSIAGIIALISFTVSGIMYLVSTGNDEMIKKAKSYMTYSLVGVVVIASAFVIIKAIDTILKADPTVGI